MHVETADAVAVRDGSEVGADPGREPVVVGVVRSPPAWFRQRVDVSYPAVGLPEDLSADLDRRRRDLRMQGLCEEGAHNAAWEELDVDGQYRASLSDEPARTVLSSLVSMQGLPVLATDRRPGFRCHREVLARVLRDRDG
jgi:hypothetical protein